MSLAGLLCGVNEIKHMGKKKPLILRSCPINTIFLLIIVAQAYLKHHFYWKFIHYILISISSPASLFRSFLETSECGIIDITDVGHGTGTLSLSLSLSYLSLPPSPSLLASPYSTRISACSPDSFWIHNHRASASWVLKPEACRITISLPFSYLHIKSNVWTPSPCCQPRNETLWPSEPWMPLLFLKINQCFH